MLPKRISFISVTTVQVNQSVHPKSKTVRNFQHDKNKALSCSYSHQNTAVLAFKTGVTSSMCVYIVYPEHMDSKALHFSLCVSTSGFSCCEIPNPTTERLRLLNIN